MPKKHNNLKLSLTIWLYIAYQNIINVKVSRQVGIVNCYYKYTVKLLTHNCEMLTVRNQL